LILGEAHGCAEVCHFFVKKCLQSVTNYPASVHEMEDGFWLF